MSWIEKTWRRYRWLKAYKHDLDKGYGDLRERQFWARMFNKSRFWWQKEIKIPEA